jgi:hypothetical protein
MVSLDTDVVLELWLKCPAAACEQVWTVSPEVEAIKVVVLV